MSTRRAGPCLSRQRASWSGRVISEMDSGHKDKKTGFYPKSLRLFIRILFVGDESLIYIYIIYIYIHKNLPWAPRGPLRRPLYARNKFHFIVYWIILYSSLEDETERNLYPKLKNPYCEIKHIL